MVKLSSAHKTQIIIAVIGVIGILGGALFSNWDKIFLSKPEQPVTQESENRSTTSTENSRYVISVYYYSGRDNDARRMRRTLEREGYIVNIYPRGDLNKGKDAKKSYIYFKNNDYKEMVVLRDILSRTLDEDFSVHVSGADRPDMTMRVVLINANKT